VVPRFNRRERRRRSTATAIFRNAALLLLGAIVTPFPLYILFF
jgi:hypothetical protein